MSEDLKNILNFSEKRTLNVYFLLDTSGSTKANGIINILNREINSIDSKFNEILEDLKFEDTEVRFRILRFGGFNYDKTAWLVGSRNDFSNTISIDTLVAEGNTWLAEALDELVESLEIIDRGVKPYPTMVFLVNDGDFSGDEETLNKVVKRLQTVKDRSSMILAICNFEHDVEYVIQPIITRDRFTNMMKLDNFATENFKYVLSQLKLSMVAPVNITVDDELI
jgi:uncharacterized protein YegL